jgi:hypothetical protein
MTIYRGDVASKTAAELGCRHAASQARMGGYNRTHGAFV